MTKRPSPSRSSGRDRNETGDPNQALLRSAYAADTKGVIAALENGADVNAADAVTGLTALHIAVGTNNLHLTRILVEDWEAQFQADGKGRWPSLIAAEAGVDAELADYIIEAEAQAQP
jgi:ankyrin repeat protein